MAGELRAELRAELDELAKALTASVNAARGKPGWPLRAAADAISELAAAGAPPDMPSLGLTNEFGGFQAASAATAAASAGVGEPASEKRGQVDSTGQMEAGQEAGQEPASQEEEARVDMAELGLANEFGGF